MTTQSPGVKDFLSPTERETASEVLVKASFARQNEAMASYCGKVRDGLACISIGDHFLCPRVEIYDYSSSFAWGRLSGGTYLTSLTLLADFFGHCPSGLALAKSTHIDFAKEEVATWEPAWEISLEDVRLWYWRKIINAPAWFHAQVIATLRDDAAVRWRQSSGKTPAAEWLEEQIQEHLVQGLGLHPGKAKNLLSLSFPPEIKFS